MIFPIRIYDLLNQLLGIYDIFTDTGPKYKNRVKSRVLNLRDKRNVQLRLSIIDGEITPEKFSNMTADVCIPEFSLLNLSY